MAPAPDQLSAPGAATYDSDTMVVGDGTWDFSKNTFLLPNLQGTNFDTMRYNGMGNRFSTLYQYHTIILAHGILAALVFLLLVPWSVMLARFYSREPGYAIRYHAQLHVFACILLLAAFILPFFAVGPNRSLTNPHHGIGVAIFVLFMVQLFGGRLVQYITKARSLRITIHQWLGRATALLGIVQIPLGLTLYGSPKYLFILYAVWMAFLVVVYFILNYHFEGRRELYITGGRSEAGRSEAGRTRITESEYFSEHRENHSPRWKWLGPLAAGAGLLALMSGRQRDRDDTQSRVRSRSRSVSRSRGPTVISSRRGSASYFDEKYSEAPQQNRGGGFMKMLGGAAAALGAMKLFSGFRNRRDRRDEEYSAVSTETPRRNRSGRATTVSEFNSEYTDDVSTAPPSRNPAATAQTVSGRESRAPRRPASPRSSRAPGNSRRDYYDDSEYSSYVSPSRRAPDNGAGGGGFAKGLLSGLGLGWIGKKLADRRAKKEEDRLREEDDMRSGTQFSRYTGDGYPSPSRRDSRRAPARRSTGPGTETVMTESSIDSRRVESTAPPPPRTPPNAQSTPSALLPGDLSRERSRSRRDVEHVSMPAMPSDPHGVLHSEVDSAITTRPQRRDSSRRRREGERAAAAAAARASSLAAEERDRFPTSPKSPAVGVKLRVHDDKDRNVTLRRLTEEEALETRGRAESESSMSALDSPTNARRYRRDSSPRRAELAAEHRVEDDDLAPLSPPNPAFAKGSKRAKDSGYLSAQPGPSSMPMPTQTVSSVGSHGTWSGMSISPSGRDKGNESAAADNRRRRRLERRRASSSRPSGADMFD